LNVFKHKDFIKIPPIHILQDDICSQASDESLDNSSKLDQINDSHDDDAKIITKSPLKIDNIHLSNDNYENIYELHQIFTEISQTFEQKNFEYNKNIQKWFELAFKSGFDNLENVFTDQKFQKETTAYFIYEVIIFFNILRLFF